MKKKNNFKGWAKVQNAPYHNCCGKYKRMMAEPYIKEVVRNMTSRRNAKKG